MEVVDVHAAYNGYYAVEAATLELRSPFYALLLGPNGAGKTTLIKVLVGLLRPARGYVRVYGVDPFSDRASLSKLVGYMPQPGTSRPSPFVKVRELVAMGYLSTRRPPRYIDSETERLVLESLKTMGIEDLADRRLSDLSGGELQRAVIASIIARRPRLLVLDEPLAPLDFSAKCEFAELLLRLHERLGVDVIMSTHELTLCMYSEPVVILINRRVIAYGPARDVLTPENLKRAYPDAVRISGLTILTESHAVRG